MTGATLLPWRPGTARALRSVLHGVSQVFFLRDAPLGALLLLVLAVEDPWLAALVVLGAAVQTGAGRLLGPTERARDGLMGYNGALVGAAMALGPRDWTASVPLTVLGAVACVPVHELVRRVFALRALRAARLPVSTAPFCLVAGALTVIFLPPAGPAPPPADDGALPGLLLGTVRNVSQVMFADGALTGALVLLLLAVRSRPTGLFGLLGSALAVLGALAVGEGIVRISSGLLGYSAVLAAIGIGAVAWTGRPWWQRLAGAVAGVALTMVLQPVLSLTPVPVFTWPFLLAMWAVLLAGAALERSRRRSAGEPAGRAAPDGAGTRSGPRPGRLRA
ncbi:urea transporter [Citricoccus sp. SGAir0253]|uniref:urea transporter n=1 Tax=Citricoccus sp. SGAir0253 TaxID=2567881 RepID=UPI0010CD52FB|nr:urea transporter [Citricoccus sp. SGAir0253]QCU78270.1 urea transporter [Citricoccus sp. SGAir0253]